MPERWITPPPEVTALHPSPRAADPASAGLDTPAEGQGGDPACWFHLVCTICGRMPENTPARRCSHCGATYPTG
jgi:ribosomal protein L37E